MEKQTVSAAISDSDLEQVEFKVQPLAFTLTGEDGFRETLALRVFLPKPVRLLRGRSRRCQIEGFGFWRVLYRSLAAARPLSDVLWT
jgi:hypothetical protein